MVLERPNELYKNVVEVIEALNCLPFDLLFFGRKRGENERFAQAYHINIGRELENAVDFLIKSNVDNVLDHLAALERSLDRLGDNPDHEAHIISIIPRDVIALIEHADGEALLQLVRRFDRAAERTTDQDFYQPSLNSWGHFLVNTFDVSSARATKSWCLEDVAKFLDRFGNPDMRYYLCKVIERIDDPSYMEDLAEYLRQAGREDIAGLLDGVPDRRTLDLEAVRHALREIGDKSQNVD
jgi:hypothetical protein